MISNLKTIEKAKQDIEFNAILQDLLNDEMVIKMKQYKQHYDTSTFEHCLNVAYLSYLFCKKLGWDYRSMARASMLHDLFLYDWRNSHKKVKCLKHGLHAFAHPKIALENAKKLCVLNEKEQDIILRHMWPVTITLPKYKESFLITFVDKFSAIQESFFYYGKMIKQKRIYKYGYLFACFLIMFTI